MEPVFCLDLFRQENVQLSSVGENGKKSSNELFKKMEKEKEGPLKGLY